MRNSVVNVRCVFVSRRTPFAAALKSGTETVHEWYQCVILHKLSREKKLNMFYWMERNRGGSETVEGLNDMSKAEILRGIVTEKLTTAAQEILAVVERTVAGYEEEASGFKREIDRQRRQLELLLQPRVKLERKAPISYRGDQDVVVVNQEEEEEEEEEQHAQQSGVQDTGSLGLLWYDDEESDGADEEQQLSTQPAMSSKQRREDLKDPDYQIKSRLISPRVRSDRKRPGRPRIIDTQGHLDLRICILDDSQTDVLSKSVFQRCPVQEVKCPRGLQESDFLHLLSSTFPQLASQKPFDVFTSDRSKRLQPLRVKTLTPEEIYRSIKLTGAGNSALYIRLKTGEDPQSSSEDLQPPQRPDPPPSSSATSADQTQTCTRLSSRDPSERRRRGRPRLGEEPTHHVFKVCLLEDFQSDVLSKNVLMKSSVKELQCHRGLQEVDFVELLRSTFPQLAGDNNRFDLFKSDRSRRLQRLRVKMLTPDEIYRTMKCTGVEKTLLYIRQKTEGEEEEELHDGDPTEPPSTVGMKSDEAGLGSSSNKVDVPSGSSASHQQEAEEPDDEDAAESRVASGVGRDGDDDWKPLPELRWSKTKARGAKASRTESGRTSCKVCGTLYRLAGGLIKHAWSHVEEPQSICGVCGKRFESVEELKRHLKNYQKVHVCSYCGKSFLSITGLNSHTTLHTGQRPFKCDTCNKTFTYMSGLSVHRWTHVADKPHKCDVCPKAFGLKAQLVAHRKVHMGGDKYHCNICGKSLYDLRSLTRHKLTHSGERRYGCEVCGKRFKLSCTLKSHEKIHMVRDRLFLCHICCKTFLSNSALTAHVKTHSNERPFVCIICSKGFISNGELKAHMRVHTGEAPYGCSECGRFFKRKTHLTNHVRSHLGIKLFVCGVCGKACARQEHLTVHMRTHNGERPYQCTVCDKAFTQSHCLKTHMKSHRRQDDAFLNAPAT
uniref:zinc finger and SCAN domain-containing protein 2-like isoform X2 n=1 Tax=Scatophagus argus TaxID=75038 RepID=UPI001ED800A9|nr:zinc finger and SCAN domain-containing protein 2-like isoform X2 [Scatophagus argus]